MDEITPAEINIDTIRELKNRGLSSAASQVLNGFHQDLQKHCQNPDCPKYDALHDSYGTAWE